MSNVTFSDWKKTITLFLTGQAVSLFGSALVDFSIIWYITLQTKSGVMMTVSTMCVFVPRLIISFFSGVWADRYNRKFLIMFSDAGIALVTLLLAILFISGFEKLWLIFVVLAIRSIGTGIQTPAVGAILPQIVPEDKLMKINGINGSIQSIIMLLAPAAGGALLSTIPLGMIFFVDVFTAVIGIGIMFIIQIKPHTKASEEKKGYYDDLKEGINYVKKNIFVREMLILYAFYFFLITPAAFLSPLFIVQAYGEEVWRLTANEIAFSVGMMLGGAIIAHWGGFKNGINTIALSCFVIGITNFALGIFGFYVYLSLLFIMGLFVSFFSSTEMTLFQKKVEQDMLGRVFGLVEIVSTSVMPVGMIFFGPLSNRIDIKTLFIVCGLLISMLSIYIFFNKQLKKSVEN